MTSPTETESLCSFLSSLTYNNLPPDLVHRAKASILNALGCAIGGASASSAVKARRALLSVNGQQTSTVIAQSSRTDVQTAALLNGIALTNADYDDTHLRTVIHPSGVLVSSLLAVGEERHSSGEEILLAFVVGIETELRVGNCISPGHYDIGWYFSS